VSLLLAAEVAAANFFPGPFMKALIYLMFRLWGYPTDKSLLILLNARSKFLDLNNCEIVSVSCLQLSRRSDS
jgi:hypothetical protein